MSRSITESLTALENARNNIVDALNSKIEGGGIEKTLKISEVASKINQIEVGGGGKAVVVIVPDLNKSNIEKKNVFIEGISSTTKNFHITDILGVSTFINIYELDPSETRYQLRDPREEYDFYSNDYFTFNEPKLYYIDSKEYEFYS